MWKSNFSWPWFFPTTNKACWAHLSKRQNVTRISKFLYIEVWLTVDWSLVQTTAFYYRDWGVTKILSDISLFVFVCTAAAAYNWSDAVDLCLYNLAVSHAERSVTVSIQIIKQKKKSSRTSRLEQNIIWKKRAHLSSLDRIRKGSVIHSSEWLKEIFLWWRVSQWPVRLKMNPVIQYRPGYCLKVYNSSPDVLGVLVPKLQCIQ